MCPHLSLSPPPPATLWLLLPVCLSVGPPPLSEMKEKNPWHSPVAIIITVIGVIVIVALVIVAVLQNRPLAQKYKVCLRKIQKVMQPVPCVRAHGITVGSLSNVHKPNMVSCRCELQLFYWL